MQFVGRRGERGDVLAGEADHLREHSDRVVLGELADQVDRAPFEPWLDHPPGGVGDEGALCADLAEAERREHQSADRVVPRPLHRGQQAVVDPAQQVGPGSESRVVLGPRGVEVCGEKRLRDQVVGEHLDAALAHRERAARQCLGEHPLRVVGVPVGPEIQLWQSGLGEGDGRCCRRHRKLLRFIYVIVI
ncbi:hypothetical protein ACIQNU_18085 [Streptomyces sp. NPDC091292]|uniref:hypothetical protein n=1 Tax=Streptomyces sp. NPDC091292 TaxID=3365991 RepID=UPI0038237F5F